MLAKSTFLPDIIELQSKSDCDQWFIIKKDVISHHKDLLVASIYFAALDDGNGRMKSLDSEKAELLNDYFADIGEDLAKNFAERVNGDDNSYVSRITPICKEL